MENKIVAKNVNLHYGSKHALKNVSLDIKENAITAFIGPSGCGKSTFLKTLNRMNDYVENCKIEGTILLDGEDVYDEKVGNEENFQRQRQRWMSAQLNSLLSMMENLPKSIIELNINYIDKTIQQMLIPRSMLLIGTFIWSLIMSVIALTWALKWWLLFILTSLSLWIAIPRKMRNGTLAKLITHLPRLTWKMLSNIRHIDRKNREFIHTTHE